MEGAEKAIMRVRHVAPETVLEGVDLDDAVRIKRELVALGCKAQAGKER
jgi:ribosomal protein L7/L12